MTRYISSPPAMSNPTILVVEDEKTIRDLIGQFLRDEGYQVILATDGNRALEILTSIEENTQIDMIVLDLMLPGLNGIEICQFLRRQGNTIPILMLSAKGREADRVLGLEMGADDYLVKPFGLPELRARCRALLRRALPTTETSDLEEMVEFKDIIIYPQQYRVLVRGEEISLSRKEFSLLSLFMQNPRRVFSRDLLIDRVWGADFMGDTKTVDVHIRWLRSKIEEDPSHPIYLLTVRGFGYRFG
jgi:two-component system, OmpR family, phosphate regulon response regulator PhoB